MAITQMQIIQSLGEAMSWFERELSWDVDPKEQRHLVGRVGELYVALITNGQMATKVNQKGYDVVSAEGERISVKTTAQMGTCVQMHFNPNTLNEVDRIVILRVNTDEMQIEVLLDEQKSSALAMMSEPNAQGKTSISLSKLARTHKARDDLEVVRVGSLGGYEVRELENGTIEVEVEGRLATSAIAELRKLAEQLHIGVLNGAGNPHNTRQLGNLVLKGIEAAGR